MEIKMSDFLTSDTYQKDTIYNVFDIAAQIKAEVKIKKMRNLLAGYTCAMIFQKPSLRTRCTFDIGMSQLGGQALYLGPSEISLGIRESSYDIAKNLERWCDIIVARVFSQKDVQDLADASFIPVINALSDDEHPCQAMADFFTLWEKGLHGKTLKMAYIGDGNNVCTSLMIVAAIMGAEFRAVTPIGFEPAQSFIDKAQKLAGNSGSKIIVTNSVEEGISGANAIYTDTWASMHHTAEEAEERKGIFLPYQINRNLCAIAEKDAYVMHCLPAHRNEEITDEIMDGPNSIVFDEAENRLHIQKIIMLNCLGKLKEL